MEYTKTLIDRVSNVKSLNYGAYIPKQDCVEIINIFDKLELYKKAFDKACGHLEGYCETSEGKLVEIFEDDEFTRPSKEEWKKCLLDEVKRESEKQND